jgi:pyruvate dehydrogenase E1 component alpha subunit
MYRFGPHTTVDDPTVYRDEAELERWKRLDPIPRMERFLRDRGLLDDEAVEEIEEHVRAAVGRLIDRAESFDADPSEMFEHAYAEPTPRIREQRASLSDLRERHGDDRLTRDE